MSSFTQSERERQRDRDRESERERDREKGGDRVVHKIIYIFMTNTPNNTQPFLYVLLNRDT